MTVAARREREREERRERILDAAEHIFESKGLDAATMEDIADQAQLGKGTLYLYFRTKEDLLLAMALRHQRKLLAIFEGVVAEPALGVVHLRRLLSAWTDHMSSSQERLRMVIARWITATPFEDEGGEEFRTNVRQIFGIICSAVARGQSDGSVRDDSPPERLAIQLWSGANGALLMSLKVRCLPKDSPVVTHAPTIDEHLDFLVDALEPRRASRTEQAERLASDIAMEAS